MPKPSEPAAVLDAVMRWLGLYARPIDAKEKTPATGETKTDMQRYINWLQRRCRRTTQAKKHGCKDKGI